jgi:molybdate transport system substrate-binding protein
MKFFRGSLRGILAFVVTMSVAAPVVSAEAEKPGLLVLAAASLTNVMGELCKAYAEDSRVTVRFSFAASSALARQIESGAPAEAFISADQEWMDYLQSRNLVSRASRVDLAGNRLVLIAPADSTLQLTIEPGFDLAGALGGGRLSTGDPDTVPVGRYARSALTSLGVWNQVADRLVRADNVRGAMNFVSRGEVPLGIVYATDAQIDEKVRVVATFPDNSHPAITYPAAATATAGPDAAAFLAFLRSSEAAPVWKKFGFLELAK